VPEASVVPPASVVPSDKAVPSESTARPGERCPAGVLTELRVILEPLLTTGPMEAIPAAGTDGEETW
jgi:hypothetical protein